MANILPFVLSLSLFKMVLNIPLIEIESRVRIQGSHMTSFNGRRFLSFRGIPYAEPPVGELRFKAPVRKQWTKRRFDATKNGPKCIQHVFFILGYNNEGQEDCLILNVYTHNTTKPLRKVMAFIHGGAFLLGSSLSNEFGPKRLLDQDVVLVTFNYRLGPFGFLSTMSEACPGNFGLLDQVEALKWIQRNIAAFGGDPNKVTIFGESAGGASVMGHLISPVSKGLFHRAIVQSASPFASWAEQTNPRDRTKLLADKVGCLNSNTTNRIMMECLRIIPAGEIRKAGNELNNFGKFVHFGPVADGYFFADLPSKLFKNNGISNRVPLLMGINKDEGLLFTTFAHLLAPHLSYDMLKVLTGITLNIDPEEVKNETIQLIEKQYFHFESEPTRIMLQDAMSKAATDSLFAVPHYEAVKILLKSQQNTFLYSFDYITDHLLTKLFSIKKGVAHGDDLFFLFESPFYFPFDYKKPNDKRENEFLDIWTSFAETGIPKEELLNETSYWQPIESEHISVYHLDKKTTVEEYKPEIDWKPDFWLSKIPLVKYDD